MHQHRSPVHTRAPPPERRGGRTARLPPPYAYENEESGDRDSRSNPDPRAAPRHSGLRLARAKKARNVPSPSRATACHPMESALGIPYSVRFRKTASEGSPRRVTRFPLPRKDRPNREG